MHTQLPPPESGTLAVSGCPTPAAGMEPLTPLAHASPPQQLFLWTQSILASVAVG